MNESKTVKTYNLTYHNYQYLIMMTILNLLINDDFEGAEDDEIDDDINDSDIDENSGEYHTNAQSSAGAANMDDE